MNEPEETPESPVQSPSEPDVNIMGSDPKGYPVAHAEEAEDEPKPAINLYFQDGVEVELEHFRLVGLPDDIEAMGGGPLPAALAMLSEILELRQAVFDLTAALVEDRKRIRRLERQSNGPGMGGMGMGLAATPLARATANGEPTPDHPKPTPPIDLAAVRDSVQKDEDG
jgi:hypothetical protein